MWIIKQKTYRRHIYEIKKDRKIYRKRIVKYKRKNAMETRKEGTTRNERERKDNEEKY